MASFGRLQLWWARDAHPLVNASVVPVHVHVHVKVHDHVNVNVNVDAHCSAHCQNCTTP